MHVIFIIGSIQALFFSILLLGKKQKIFSDKILVAFFLLFSLHLLIKYIYTLDIVSKFPHLMGIDVGFPLLYGPLLYFYVSSLVSNQNYFRKDYFLHFLPFILIIALLLPFYSMSADEKLKFISSFDETRKNYMHIFLLQIVPTPVYVVWILVLLKKHTKNIRDYFSFEEEIKLRWLRNLTIGMAAVSVVVVLVHILWPVFSPDISFQREIPIYISLSFFVFFMGYFGFKQGQIFTESSNTIKIPNTKSQSEDHEKANENQNVSKVAEYKVKPHKKTKDIESERIIEKLKKYMNEEKPYLEEKLTLSEVALALEIPHYRLTQIFNEQLNQNFFNFINSYRVEKFKNKIVDPQNNSFTILGIAYECGFASKASFNRVFKQITNLTPSQFRKKHLQHTYNQ